LEFAPILGKTWALPAAASESISSIFLFSHLALPSSYTWCLPFGSTFRNTRAEAEARFGTFKIAYKSF
jgi:hypothetical protein